MSLDKLPRLDSGHILHPRGDSHGRSDGDGVARTLLVGSGNEAFDAVAGREEGVEALDEGRVAAEQRADSVNNAWSVDAVCEHEKGGESRKADRRTQRL